MKTEGIIIPEKIENHEDRYVIRIEFGPGSCSPVEFDYYYNVRRAFSPNYKLDAYEINYAKTHAYKTRAGAERSIIKIKRYCVTPLIEIINHKDFEKKGFAYVADKFVQKTDWENSKYTFSVITVDEMIAEVKKYQKEHGYFDFIKDT